MTHREQYVSGRLYLRRSERPGLPDCYVWRHPEQATSQRWLCAVHGISRDAREQARLLAPAAAQFGYSIVAPLFDPVRFRGYQRLERRVRRADAGDRLCDLLDDLAGEMGVPGEIDLFGFSGGAQFAHRFALMHPQRVRRLAVASAGWYTMPDPGVSYPYGLAAASNGRLRTFQLEAFLSLPLLVLVGDEDNCRDAPLRKRAALDLQQGSDRFARACNWHSAVSRARADRAFPSLAPQLQIMPGVGHSFASSVCRGGLDHRIFTFFDSGSSA